MYLFYSFLFCIIIILLLLHNHIFSVLQMHSNLWIFIWRRKLSFLLVVSGLVLLGLWTWAILIDTTAAAQPPAAPLSNSERQQQQQQSTGYQQVHIIQKLIEQANRVLRAERLKDNAVEKSPSPVQRLGNVRFLRPPIMALRPIGRTIFCQHECSACLKRSDLHREKNKS